MTFDDTFSRITYEREDRMHFMDEPREDWESIATVEAAPISGIGDTEGAEDLYRVWMFGA
jgi:hypothetical protein